MPGKVALFAALGVALAGCGGVRAQLPTQEPPSTTFTWIVGGEQVHRTLIRQVLRGMPHRRVSVIVVEPASRRFEPFVPGDVVLTMRAGRSDLRASWESWLIAGAVDFLAAERHLPRVVSVEEPGGSGGRLHWPDAPREPRPGPPPATQTAAAALARSIRGAAATAHARVVSLEVLTPYGLAPAVTLAVEDPPAFLRYRLEGFLRAWDEPDALEGSYVWVVDDDGHYVWSSAVDNRTGPASGGVRPDLAGCDPFPPLSRPVEARDPPSCPA